MTSNLHSLRCDEDAERRRIHLEVLLFRKRWEFNRRSTSEHRMTLLKDQLARFLVSLCESRDEEICEIKIVQLGLILSTFKSIVPWSSFSLSTLLDRLLANCCTPEIAIPVTKLLAVLPEKASMLLDSEKYKKILKNLQKLIELQQKPRLIYNVAEYLANLSSISNLTNVLSSSSIFEKLLLLVKTDHFRQEPETEQTHVADVLSRLYHARLYDTPLDLSEVYLTSLYVIAYRFPASVAVHFFIRAVWKTCCDSDPRAPEIPNHKLQEYSDLRFLSLGLRARDSDIVILTLDFLRWFLARSPASWIKKLYEDGMCELLLELQSRESVSVTVCLLQVLSLFSQRGGVAVSQPFGGSSMLLPFVEKVLKIACYDTRADAAVLLLDAVVEADNQETLHTVVESIVTLTISIADSCQNTPSQSALWKCLEIFHFVMVEEEFLARDVQFMFRASHLLGTPAIQRLLHELYVQSKVESLRNAIDTLVHMTSRD